MRVKRRQVGLQEAVKMTMIRTKEVAGMLANEERKHKFVLSRL